MLYFYGNFANLNRPKKILMFSLKSEKGKKLPNGNPGERKKKKQQGAPNILMSL
jgi:hypothetical protein